MHWQQIIQDVQTKGFELDFKIYNQSWQGHHASQRLPKRHKTKKRKHISLQFFAFSYLHGLHEMMVLLHFDFIRGHERRLETKRKEKLQTQTQKKWKFKRMRSQDLILRSQIQNGAMWPHQRPCFLCRYYIGCLLKDDGQINHSDFHLTS